MLRVMNKSNLTIRVAVFISLDLESYRVTSELLLSNGLPFMCSYVCTYDN